MEVGKNALMALPAVRRWRLTKPRAGMRYDGSDAHLLHYVFGPLEIVDTTTSGLAGKRVAEVGPGDFLSTGLALLAAGAASYTAIDRFAGDYSRPDAKAWYRGIRDEWSRFRDDSWPEDLDPHAFPEGYSHLVRTINQPIETADEESVFDVVCSMSVGEHVSDIDGFAEANARLLAPGGVAVHRIDFGAHGVWLNYSDPLYFLKFPEPLWWAMGSTRGYPNRRRLHEMVGAFTRAGLDVSVLQADLIPDVDLTALPARYRKMPAESVATREAVITAVRR
jgi:SAM-dependent methyltransferase